MATRWKRQVFGIGQRRASHPREPAPPGTRRRRSLLVSARVVQDPGSEPGPNVGSLAKSESSAAWNSSCRSPVVILAKTSRPFAESRGSPARRRLRRSSVRSTVLIDGNSHTQTTRRRDTSRRAWRPPSLSSNLRTNLRTIRLAFPDGHGHSWSPRVMKIEKNAQFSGAIGHCRALTVTHGNWVGQAWQSRGSWVRVPSPPQTWA